MIKKLDRLQGRDIYENTALAKLNEVIDAVNVLKTKVEIVEECLHPTAMVDPYAEQRKWIGKLCRFWDDGYDSNYILLLKQIDDDDTPFVDDNDVCWEHCEPVKPDDDIIYKGE